MCTKVLRILLAVMAFAVPSVAESQCLSSSVAAFYVNGIWQTDEGMSLARMHVERMANDAIRERNLDSAGCWLTVELAENRSSGVRSAGDLFESAIQAGVVAPNSFRQFANRLNFVASLVPGEPLALFLAERLADRVALDFDSIAADERVNLREHVDLYSNELQAGKRVVIIAHSQGNYFANRALAELVTLHGAEVLRRVAIVSVATPASVVAPGDILPSPHTTLLEDPIHLLPFLMPLPPVLPDTPERTCSSPYSYSFNCHYIQTYLDVILGLDQARIATSLSVQRIRQKFGNGLAVELANDFREVEQGARIAIDASNGLLRNDVPLPGDTNLEVEYLGSAPIGFRGQSDGGFVFDASSYSASDVSVFVSYLVNSSAGRSRPATLQIRIVPRTVTQPAPVARDDFGTPYTAVQGGVLPIPTPGVLANDTYPPGATVDFLDPLPPSLSAGNPDGSFTLDLSAQPSVIGPIVLRYVIHSANGDSNIATVTVQVTPATAPDFVDDFNRPDGPVGNGWTDALANTQGNLVVRDGALSTPGPNGSGGVFRPVDTLRPINLSARITYLNGFGGARYRYDTTILVGSDAGGETGYGVVFSRGDENYADSAVSLIFNGVVLQRLSSSFQFTESLTTSFTWDPEGAILGSVSGDGNTFAFNFAPRSVHLQGQNLVIRLGFPDGRSSLTVNPTVDDFSLTYGPPSVSGVRLNWNVAPNGEILSMQVPPWSSGVVYFGWQYLLNRRNLSANSWGVESCDGGAGGSASRSSFETETDFIRSNGGMNVFGIAGPQSRGGIGSRGCLVAGNYYFEITDFSAQVNGGGWRVSYYYELYYDGISTVTPVNNLSASGVIGSLAYTGAPLSPVNYAVIYTDFVDRSIRAGGLATVFDSSGRLVLNGLAMEQFAAPATDIGDGAYTIRVFTDQAAWTLCNAATGNVVWEYDMRVACAGSMNAVTFYRMDGVWSDRPFVRLTAVSGTVTGGSTISLPCSALPNPTPADYIWAWGALDRLYDGSAAALGTYGGGTGGSPNRPCSGPGQTFTDFVDLATVSPPVPLNSEVYLYAFAVPLANLPIRNGYWWSGMNPVHYARFHWDGHIATPR